MKLAVCRLEGRTGHDAGRALLETLCRMETGQPLPEIQTEPHGKPRFVDSPLHFSITHTSRHAFCVLARCPVGIDAEERGRIVHPSLVKKILSPPEQQRYLRAPDPNTALLRLWVLKEAAVKLTGEGLRGYPNWTDFSPEDPRLRSWDGCIYALLAQDPTEGVTFYAF